jgi:hypothetical protein
MHPKHPDRSRRLAAFSGAAMVLITLAGSGCDVFRDPDCRGPDGAWTDVTTQHGTYDGFEVRASCRSDADLISILGTGTHWFRDVAIGAPGREAVFDDFADRVSLAFPAHLDRTFVAGSPVQGCTNTEAVIVSLSDWHEVDGTIDVVGEMLRRDQLREEVLINISTLCLPGY